MRYHFALILAAAAASTAANAQTSANGETAALQCAIGKVTGVGGSEQSVREYLATPERDKYRYIADNPIQCRISDEGRASACTGITTLKREQVSVYDQIDSTMITVVARVELDHGTYPVLIAVPRKDVQCQE
ncbi:hypothetical protein [Paraburkholderia kirstenboschensis]|jgi:hypothetical protein|uniref:Lipoprotein n=1 Tax=Paraburkholderia kirstenboschensis TaxID=1245436 RepID=A0ABZ0EDE3_9BURK|nr:hypothetical protein [Paraburkholderia kirstenboschensis]WOD14955.1 hypothetical protein RW095_16550 [Paraburkholderia kirstenboschensis]CAD6552399.1 hypothetical protein LMG28727_05355 [Paraburkholderia kirstenboschensis]